MAKEKRIREEPLDDFLERMKDAIVIDRHDLDSMWVAQPQQFQEIAERLALHISYRDEAKDELKDVAAEVDATIREDDQNRIDRDGGKKMTETAIANAVREDKKWKGLNERLTKLNREVKLLEALKETFQMRRYALQDLTSLHVSGYAMSTSSKPARERAGDRGRLRMQEERRRRQEEE